MILRRFSSRAALGRGERLAVVVLGALQVFIAAGDDLLALFLELGSNLDAAVGRERIGVGQRLSQRRVEPFELGLAKLDEPGAQQEGENATEHGADAQAGDAAFNQHSQAGEQRYQEDGDPRFASAFHRLGNDQSFQEAQGLIHSRQPGEELIAGIAEFLV